MEMTRRNMLGAGAAFAAAASFAPAAFGGWEPSESYPDPAIKILDPSFARYRINNAGVERLATGMRWCEGPVWMGDARCLLWSDIPNNRIMRWDEETARVSVYRKPSNNANGIPAIARAGWSAASIAGGGSRAPNTTAPSRS